MKTFTDTREAKEFLINNIVEEAEHENAPLSDTERKVLYFTETAWMPEDTWQANEIFDRDYDQNAYEHRIAQLASKWKSNPQHGLRRWNEAVTALRREDHYLLVLIGPRLQKAMPTWRSPRELLKLTLTAFALVILIVIGIFLYARFFGK